jgi:hypothetical protein
MKMHDIRTIGKKYGINSFGKSKEELIREIQRAEGNFDCFGTAQDYCDQMECLFRTLCLPVVRKPKKKGEAGVAG